MEWLGWFGLTAILYVVVLLFGLFCDWINNEGSTVSTALLSLFFAAYMAYNIVFNGRLF